MLMSLKLTPKFAIAGLLLASVIVIGTIYVSAQNGSSSAVFDSDEVTLVGTVISLDEDHGFTMEVDSVTYYVGIPYTVDKADLGIAVGSEVTVTGYLVDSPMIDTSGYTMIHATSVNGIIIDHDMQAQARDRSGDCDGMGSGNGPQHGHMKGKN